MIPTGNVTKRTWTYEGRKHSAYAYTLTVVAADGTRRRYRKQYPTCAEAREALDALREELNNPTVKAQPSASITLGDALVRLIELKSRKRARSESMSGSPIT